MKSPNVLPIICSAEKGRGCKKKNISFWKINASFQKVETFRFADYRSLHYYCICIGFHIYPLIQSIHGNYRHIIPQPGYRTALAVNPIILYMEIQDRPATCNPYRYGTHDCAAFLHRHLSEIPFSLE